MQKIGPITNNSEIIVQIVWKNPKHVILINNLSVKDVTENKRFWKTIKPFFTDKTKNSNNIILTENF